MRQLLALIAGLATLSTTLLAQYPGQIVEAPYERVRSQYVSLMYSEILPVLESWRSSFEKGDLKRLVGLLEPDALYSPVEGWITRDRNEARDSLATRLPSIRGYFPTPFDFTASGNLAYIFGRLGYSVVESGGLTREVRGTFTMVLFLRGNGWKVRSYVERLGALP